MYRIRNFIFTEVMNLNGKNLGFVGDLIVDFNFKLVKGFDVISNSILKKDINVYVEDIVSFDPVIIAIKSKQEDVLKFNDIRNIDIVDNTGNIIGRLEDIVFYKGTFRIRAFIISRGFFYDIAHGKKILPAKDLILGEKNILYRRIHKI
ncbi:PRC-barrel domain-containing protein [Clostridium tyrobutyricum]|uniref:PRC-barrel domain-containing protein n=1 Tax=Clostridium tyrobutyricum TaxID=1519 RepID=UPI0018AB2FF1|nr:PRC-barrel domain-containing protein [Clostridium tyrobutyricum]MBV4423944.1 PRC-barrel domain-containing protein [Clostridium tyrobutyricum]MBV4426821.1 PRC-barrel domain-containing protein [Clostridium tyrobutyricum]MBV4429861.1 PRC-barrel domain-containing protein [Clostridium tyrobutyricum]MBV4441977.1 PRC-barrel domain-containing protein [Clostridium tyrobutyricum]